MDHYEGLTSDPARRVDLSHRCRVAAHLRALERTPRKHPRLTVSRQRCGQPCQRTGRESQRDVQHRTDQLADTLANRRLRRPCHPRIARLVQQPLSPHRPRRRPRRRLRGSRVRESSINGLGNTTTKSPSDPVGFSSQSPQHQRAAQTRIHDSRGPSSGHEPVSPQSL